MPKSILSLSHQQEIISFHIFSLENWNDKHDTEPKPQIFALMIKKQQQQ